ncbi:MAG: hypothetical protein KDB00_26105 [Planctomycetales bacterium]|nr:hypothetical protein [Planctomycetales bacterium]
MLAESPVHHSSVSDQLDLEILLGMYLQLLRRKGHKRTTLRHRSEQIMIFIHWAAGHSVTGSDQIDAVTLADFRTHLGNKTDRAGYRWNPTMQRRTLNCVSNWLSWMLQDEWLPGTATDALKALR